MGFIFVDDTDLIVIAKENETIDNVQDRQHQGTLCWKKNTENYRWCIKTIKVLLTFNRLSMENGECSYKTTAKSKYKILGDKSTGCMILILPVE